MLLVLIDFLVLDLPSLLIAFLILLGREYCLFVPTTLRVLFSRHVR